MEKLKKIYLHAALTSLMFDTQRLPSKNEILEPLCLYRLAMLSFYPVGTKIKIENNSVMCQKPSVLQGTIRWSRGDNRNDIHNLYHPLQLAFSWYGDKVDKDIIAMASRAG